MQHHAITPKRHRPNTAKVAPAGRFGNATTCRMQFLCTPSK